MLYIMYVLPTALNIPTTFAVAIWPVNVFWLAQHPQGSIYVAGSEIVELLASVSVMAVLIRKECIVRCGTVYILRDICGCERLLLFVSLLSDSSTVSVVPME